MGGGEGVGPKASRQIRELCEVSFLPLADGHKAPTLLTCLILLQMERARLGLLSETASIRGTIAFYLQIQRLGGRKKRQTARNVLHACRGQKETKVAVC